MSIYFIIIWHRCQTIHLGINLFVYWQNVQRHSFQLNGDTIELQPFQSDNRCEHGKIIALCFCILHPPINAGVNGNWLYRHDIATRLMPYVEHVQAKFQSYLKCVACVKGRRMRQSINMKFSLIPLLRLYRESTESNLGATTTRLHENLWYLVSCIGTRNHQKQIRCHRRGRAEMKREKEWNDIFKQWYAARH